MYGSRGCPAPIIDRDCDILDQNVVTRMIKVDDTFEFTPVVKQCIVFEQVAMDQTSRQFQCSNVLVLAK